MDVPQFVHSPIEGLWGCCQIWLLWKKLIWTFVYRFLWKQISISSLVKCLFIPFAHFFSLECFFSYCWVLRYRQIGRIQILYQIYSLQIFSPSLWIVFSFQYSVFSRAEFKIFDVLINHFFLLWIMFFMSCLRILYWAPDQEDFLLCFLRFILS